MPDTSFRRAWQEQLVRVGQHTWWLIVTVLLGLVGAVVALLSNAVLGILVFAAVVLVAQVFAFRDVLMERDALYEQLDVALHPGFPAHGLLFNMDPWVAQLDAPYLPGHTDPVMFVPIKFTNRGSTPVSVEFDASWVYTLRGHKLGPYNLRRWRNAKLNVPKLLASPLAVAGHTTVEGDLMFDASHVLGLELDEEKHGAYAKDGLVATLHITDHVSGAAIDCVLPIKVYEE